MRKCIYKHEKYFIKAQQRAEKQKLKQELYNIAHQYDPPKEKLSFSKKFAIFICADFLFIQLYAMYMIYVFQDTSALPSLLTIVASAMGQVSVLISYNSKSKAENTEGGIVFHKMLLDAQQNDSSLEIIDDSPMDDFSDIDPSVLDDINAEG